MNHCSRLPLLFLALLAPLVSAAAPPASPVAPYHLVWDSPSRDCHGSMPLGNGDISLNACEPSGDLCCYIGPADEARKGLVERGSISHRQDAKLAKEIVDR